MILAFVCSGAARHSLMDTNADAQVDVLDVQNVSKALLASSSPSVEADVNRDGRVDILDLQCVVNRATGVAESGTQESTPKQTPPLAPRVQTDHLLGIRIAQRAPLDPPAAATPDALAKHGPSTLLGPGEMHRLGLAAHAPPTC